MERLTYWNDNTKRYEVNDNGIIHFGSITDKLAAYENTGFTPKVVLNINNIANIQSNSIFKLGEKLKQREKQRDYWEREAKKWADKTFDIRYKIAKKICDRCPDEDTKACENCMK